MKFRPQIQLRFRDAGHYESVKIAATSQQVSVNEYVLRALESMMHGGGTGRRATPEESGNSGSKRVRSAHVDAEAPSSTVGSSPTRATKTKELSKSEQLKALRERNAQ